MAWMLEATQITQRRYPDDIHQTLFSCAHNLQERPQRPELMRLLTARKVFPGSSTVGSYSRLR